MPLKPIGSVTTYLRKFERAGKDVRVPCGTCNACCRSSYLLVEVTESERADFPEAVPVPDDKVSSCSSPWMLPKKADGSCVHLKEGKCSVYAKRPQSCRSYDCRFDLLTGIVPDDPVMIEALGQWDNFAMKTREDRVTYTAIRLALTLEGRPQTMKEVAARLRNLSCYIPLAEKLDSVMMNATPAELKGFAKLQEQVCEELVQQGVMVRIERKETAE
jgi:Fe-S-cluster containining protein